MVGRTAAAFSLLLLLAAVFRLPGEEAPEAEPRARRLLLFFELDRQANFNREEELLLYASLLVRLTSAGSGLAVKEYPSRAPGANDRQRTELARSLGADGWLRVGLTGSWLDVGLSASSYDLIGQTAAFAFQLRKPMRRGAVDLERDFWDEVAAAVHGYYSQAAANRTVSGEVLFQARPGTRITATGLRPLVADAQGEARAVVQVPATISVRARRPGLFPVEGKYFLSLPQTTIQLEQEPAARFALEAYLNNLSFPGFEFSYFLIPGLFYARTGFTSYLLGLHLADSHEGGSESLLTGRALNILDLGLGAYLNDADRSVRLYAGLGAFLRLITTLVHFGLEPIAPWGLQAAFGLEYSRRPDRRLYLEYAPLLYFTGRPDLMLASFAPDSSRIGYVFLPKGVFSLLNMRLGVRWQI